MRFCTYCGASLTQNPINPSSGTTSTSASTSITSTSGSQAGDLLFQRLSSKTVAKPQSKVQTQVTPKPRGVAVVTKPKKVKTSQPRTTRVVKQTIVDQKLKLRLLEHLKELNKLDRTLEASAIIRYRDHTVLAAATSTRTSENLMVTITSTIFDICQDSIKALGGGKIRILNITAENVTLLLSPIDDGTVLIVVTNPKSNVGLISMYMELTCDKIREIL